MATRNVSWTILMDAKTSEQWSQVTTVLPKGYMAIEIGDVTRIKIGDGTKTYADLDYIESNADLTNYYNKTEVDNKIIDAMTKAFILKGTVDSVEALPASDNKVGDLYIVTLEEGNAAEYVWTGTSWEYMGQTFTVDLSGYYTSGEVDALLLTKAAAVHTHTASDVSGLATVATSGSYSDLSNTPTIDTALNSTSTNAVQNKVINEAITNIETEISGKANATHTHTASEVSGLATVATSGKYSDLTGRPTIDTALNSTSTNAVQNKVIKAALDGKSDSGHTHSYSDLTDKPIIDAELSSTSTNAVQNKAVTTALAGKSDTGHTHTASDVTGLATVATSGSYTDLSNKPTIPKVDPTLSATSTNAIQNKAVKTALDGKSDTGHTHTATEVSGLADVATSGSYSDLSDTPTIDTALSATSTNAVQNKVINTALAGKANATHNHTATEVSGLSTVATSGKYSDLTGKPTIPTVDATLSTTSTNAIQNKAVATALNGKANASHTHEMSEITDLADELAKYVQATDTLVINCTL